MAKLIEKPSRIEAAGNMEKIIREFVGKVNTETSAVSIARMESPTGWEEPGQTPEFREYTIVLRGFLKAETREATFDVGAGQAFVAEPGEWVRYSSPYEGGAEYISVCMPAFSPELVQRDK